MKKRYLGTMLLILFTMFCTVACGNEDSSDNEDYEKPESTMQVEVKTKEPVVTEPVYMVTEKPVETQSVPTQTPEPTLPVVIQTPEPTVPAVTQTKAPETDEIQTLAKEGVYTLYNEKTKCYLAFNDRTLVLSKSPVYWTFSQEYDDVFRIIAEDSDLMLDIDNARVVEGTTIKLWTKTKYDVQLWRAIKNNNGTYSIVYSADNTFCLGFDRGNAKLQHRNESNSMQEWRLVGVDTTAETDEMESVKSGIYTFYNEKSASYLSFNDKTLVLSKNPSNWTINEVYKNKCNVYAEDTDTLLDIDNAYVVAGNTIKLWTNTGYDVQFWSINKNKNGTYTIVYSGDNQYCLGFTDGKAQLQLRDKNNPMQEWKLVDASASAKMKYRTYMSKNGIIELRLQENITDVISETRLQQWANELETAYYTFRDLTNYTPYEHIIVQAYKKEKYIGYVISNSNIIHMDKDFTRTDLGKMALRDSDWNFCALHEMGHMFDMNQPWNFEAEVMTDLKVAYVLEKNKVAAAPSEFPASEYFYGADIIKAYDRLGNDFSQKYNIYGIAKRFVEIKEDIGWEAFEKTFHDLKANEASYANVSNQKKFETFVDKLSFYGNKDVKSYFTKKEWNVIINEIKG